MKKGGVFCISQNQLDSLEKGNYKIVVDTTLFDGELNYGELYIKGKSKKEIFLSSIYVILQWQIMNYPDQLLLRFLLNGYNQLVS